MPGGTASTATFPSAGKPAWLLAPGLAIVLAGCTSLAERIAIPRTTAILPPAQQADFERATGITRRVSSLGNGVDLAWRFVPAANRGFHYAYERTHDGASFDFGPDPEQDIQPLPASGTVIYLHGWSMDSTAMLPWALALAEHGYDGIAVDLRGHGESSDAPVGYGIRETQDIARLLAILEESGQLAHPVYLFGFSYGAATAMLAEAPTRDHVAGIVALAPYPDAASGIRAAVGHMLDSDGRSLRSRLLLGAIRLRYGGEGAVDREIEAAARTLGLDLEEIDVAAAATRSRTCTVLLHGGKDHLVPVTGSRALAAASPWIRYIELEDENHMSLPLRVDLLTDPLVGWMASVAAGRCELPLLPEDPQAALQDGLRERSNPSKA